MRRDRQQHGALSEGDHDRAVGGKETLQELGIEVDLVNAEGYRAEVMGEPTTGGGWRYVYGLVPGNGQLREPGRGRGERFLGPDGGDPGWDVLTWTSRR